jgi:cytochrome P450
LRSFPGPFLARISKFWTCHIHVGGEYHRELRKLHKKYGDILRVGPDELDINDVEAIKQLYGTSSKMIKGPWYDGPAAAGDTRSIQSTRDHIAHRWRRGIWAQSSSVAAINDFQPLLLEHVDELIKKMSGSKEVDIGQLFTYLSFDIMGDLA